MPSHGCLHPLLCSRWERVRLWHNANHAMLAPLVRLRIGIVAGFNKQLAARRLQPVPIMEGRSLLASAGILLHMRCFQNTALATLPPPGNDLARCLNWGGGMGAYQGQGVGDLLGLLEQCAVTLLDRWNVRFTPQVRVARLLSCVLLAAVVAFTFRIPSCFS